MLLEAVKPHLRLDVANRIEWAMLVVLSRAVESPDRVATGQLLAESQRVLAQNANRLMGRLKGTLEGKEADAKAVTAGENLIPGLSLWVLAKEAANAGAAPRG